MLPIPAARSLPAAAGEAAAGAAARLEGADLALVNKFGKQEAAGRGFRDFIAAALAEEIPLLIAVAPELVPAFTEFAGDYATPLTWPEAEAWCRVRQPAVA